MPLVKGKYQPTNPLYSALGQTANATQGNLGQRTNATYSGLVAVTDQAAALTTQVCTSVMVPVEIGDVITKITVLVGATAAGTPTNGFAALYSGVTVPALLGQATDITSNAIAASAAFTYTLAAPQMVTTALAPYGFIYVSVMSKATVVPSLASTSLAAAVGYKWFGNSPLFFAATHGSALTNLAPATIVTPTAQTVVPLVFLT